MQRSQSNLALILAGTATLVLAAGLVALEPPGTVREALFRGSAWLGYLTVFEAIVAGAYLRWLARWFRRPLLRVHHAASIVGLVMVTAHPLFLAFRAGSLAVFVPAVASWEAFLSNGGRPAWLLLSLASLVALLRRAIGRGWRAVHLLTYLALWLASAHIILRSGGIHELVAWGFALTVAITVVHRAWPRRVARGRSFTGARPPSEQRDAPGPRRRHPHPDGDAPDEHAGPRQENREREGAQER